MDKNSFTLLETIISIFLLSIVVVGFSNFKNYDNLDLEFMSLNKIENSFTTKNYSNNFSTQNLSLKIIKNDTLEEMIDIKQITYKDENIKLIKYEL